MAPGGLLTALICFFVPRLLVADLSSLLHRSLELFVGLLDDSPPQVRESTSSLIVSQVWKWVFFAFDRASNRRPQG